MMMGFDVATQPPWNTLVLPHSGKGCNPGNAASHGISDEKNCPLCARGRMLGCSTFPDNGSITIWDLLQKWKRRRGDRWWCTTGALQTWFMKGKHEGTLLQAKTLPCVSASGSAMIPAAPQHPASPLSQEAPIGPSPTPHNSALPTARTAPGTQNLNTLSQRSWDYWAGTAATAPRLGEVPGTFLYTTPPSVIIISVIS